MLHQNWDLYDTRHVVYRPAKMTPEQLEAGYWSAYRDFYRWENIFKSAWAQLGALEKLRHVAYAGGWKKCEPLWDWVIRAKHVMNMRPMLESILSGFGSHRPGRNLDGRLASKTEDARTVSEPEPAEG